MNIQTPTSHGYGPTINQRIGDLTVTILTGDKFFLGIYRSRYTPTALDKTYDDHAPRHSHLSPYPRYSLRMNVTVMIPQVRGLIPYYRNWESQSYRSNLKRLPYDDSRESVQLVNYLEGEDDVKSSCPLCPGRHTCYNGRVLVVSTWNVSDRPSRVGFIAAKPIRNPTPWVYPFGLWAFRCDIEISFNVSDGSCLRFFRGFYDEISGSKGYCLSLVVRLQGYNWLGHARHRIHPMDVVFPSKPLSKSDL
ncbi:UNVERIFIED_CONTAM: hypothetical protein Scaly_2713100 [Sesamum calycinum]|uniref:Uncharacterized protein n=1 Tax=Sesamum calycinum TaxID=2727403 RepID=A0AAW2J335_9LAMI